MFYKHRIHLLINCQQYVNIVTNKHFHLSHLNRVRKPSSSRKTLSSSFEDVQEHTVSGVFQDTPKDVNSFTNFYGVESDEGVITVNDLQKPDRSIDRLQKMTYHKQPMNEFRSFNFGAIRLDNENKPSFYARNPKVKSNQNAAEKLNIKENNNEQSNVKDLEANYDSKKSHVSNYHEQNQDNANNSPKVSESFIDKYYFAETCSENIVPQIKKSIDNYNGDQKFMGENMNRPEILPKTNPCGTKINTVVDHSEIDNYQSEGSNVSVSHQRNQFDSSKISESFIDEHFFADNYMKNTTPQTEKHLDNFIEDQHVNKSDNFQSKDTNVVKNQNQFDSCKVSESFIDEHYFADNYIENATQVEKHAENYIENQFFSGDASKSDCKIASDSQTNKYNAKENLKDNFQPINDNCRITAVNDSSIFRRNIKENGFRNNETGIKFNPNENGQNITTKPNDLTSTEINTVGNEINKYQKGNLQKKTDKNNTAKIKVDSTKVRKDSQTKKNSNKANSESALDSLKKSQEKEPSAESKIETAFDFVKKLKGNNLLSDDVKKGISAKKEKKLDSKRFRILKHQVPSLQYFTKDEMLELLQQSILYSDDDIVVLNKPYNLVIHESNTSLELACLSRYLDDLAKLLDQNTNSPKLITVHRLDKETTGCLLLARNEVSAARLKSLFAQRKIVKTYWIVTTKVPDPMEGIIDIPIAEGRIENRSRMVLHPKLPDETPYVNHSKVGKEAITQYSVIAVSGNAALVEVKPETGIKHQIRVHFGFGLGCPILGDHKYSYLDKLVPQKLQSDLLQRLQVRQSKVRHIPLHIHSKHILIPQYLNERNLFVTAPLPRHMSENLQFLKFKKK